MLLDIDHSANPQDVGRIVVGKLESADKKESGHDVEFWLHKAALHITSVSRAKHLNQKNDESQLKPLPKGLLLKARLLDGNFVFEPENLYTEIGNNKVEI